MKTKPLHKCYAIKRDFLRLGFRGRTAFYNACKSIDVTLNGFQLIEFYEGKKVPNKLISRLESILETLKYE